MKKSISKMGLRKVCKNPTGKPKGALIVIYWFPAELTIFIQEQWPTVIKEYNAHKEKIKFYGTPAST